MAVKVTDVTPKKKAIIIERLSYGYSVANAAVVAGVSRWTAYRWRESDEKFANDWDAAIEDGTDMLEDEARRRAHDGVTEPVFYKGDVCGEVQKYSDTLLIVLLKARRPEKYRENVKTEHSGPNGGPIPVVTAKLEDLEGLDAHELIQRYRQALR